MKSYAKILLSLFLLTAIVLPAMVVGEEIPTQCKMSHTVEINDKVKCLKGEIIKLDDEKSICCLINTLYNIRDWLFTFLFILASIFIIVAGYSFITAQGDPAKVTLARNFIIYALVGVLVAFLSQALVALVLRVAVG